LATIKALSSYKHADHFNKRVVEKLKREDTVEKEENTKEVASVVKEIQAKKPATEQPTTEQPTAKKIPAKPAAKKPSKEDK
jgi:hypothetical protein